MSRLNGSELVPNMFQTASYYQFDSVQFSRGLNKTFYGRTFLTTLSLVHAGKCRSNIVECYKSNDSFDKVTCCFDKFER